MTLFPDVDQAIQFFVDAAPVAQPRQRHAVRNGISMSYIPKEHPIHAFKTLVRIRAKEAYKGPPLKGPLIACFVFLLPRPARLVWKTRAMPRTWAAGRPDADNFCKAVLDAMTGLVFEDDSQVVELRAQKFYASGDEAPGVHVFVKEVA